MMTLMTLKTLMTLTTIMTMMTLMTPMIMMTQMTIAIAIAAIATIAAINAIASIASIAAIAASAAIAAIAAISANIFSFVGAYLRSFSGHFFLFKVSLHLSLFSGFCLVAKQQPHQKENLQLRCLKLPHQLQQLQQLSHNLPLTAVGELFISPEGALSIAPP